MPERIRYYTLRTIDRLPQFERLTPRQRRALRVVGQVLPFRVNNYVADELIDWDDIPDDPIFQLTFLQEGMLLPDHFAAIDDALRRNVTKERMSEIVAGIRAEFNPHPAGQLTDNIPLLDDEPVPGLQHKYRQTCLVFPRNGQTCHSYCTFCFRWPQFVGMPDLKFATGQARRFQEYIRAHHELTDVLFTGGDPMIMNVRNLAAYIEPLIDPAFEHIRTIRIGTKSLSYWPQRFVTDRDADEVLRLFGNVIASGKHLAVMAHVNHWRELETDIVRRAIDRIRGTGAVIRTQSPLIRHINDDPAIWERMWKEQARLGMVPYYMFVERDTGAKPYFAVPLVRAWQIFRGAYRRVSGIARTVRGPSMSAWPGKVAIQGVSEVNGERVFVLSMLQSRVPELVGRPFFAKYDPAATWLDQLEPAFADRFPFQRRHAARMPRDERPAHHTNGRPVGAQAEA